MSCPRNSEWNPVAIAVVIDGGVAITGFVGSPQSGQSHLIVGNNAGRIRFRRGDANSSTANRFTWTDEVETIRSR